MNCLSDIIWHCRDRDVQTARQIKNGQNSAEELGGSVRGSGHGDFAGPLLLVQTAGPRFDFMRDDFIMSQVQRLLDVVPPRADPRTRRARSHSQGSRGADAWRTGSQRGLLVATSTDQGRVNIVRVRRTRN